jgi:stage III sporulation protein AA
MRDGELKALKNIASMNIRLAREIHGCADKLLPYLTCGPRAVYSTLVIGPPRSGKTTVLRDIIRQISGGAAGRGNFAGVQVGLVDERSEIAACQNGIPTVDLGPRVDVLDGCPKATGLLMLIRAMSPQVVVTDELGREADALAVLEALHAGVSVIASVHGRDAADILRRPYIGSLIEARCFERYVMLSGAPSVGTVAAITAAHNDELLYSLKGGVKICG